MAELLDEGLSQAIHALLKTLVSSCTMIDVEIHHRVSILLSLKSFIKIVIEAVLTQAAQY